jgi:hypothetical protein
MSMTSEEPSKSKATLESLVRLQSSRVLLAGLVQVRCPRAYASRLPYLSSPVHIASGRALQACAHASLAQEYTAPRLQRAHSTPSAIGAGPAAKKRTALLVMPRARALLEPALGR